MDLTTKKAIDKGRIRAILLNRKVKKKVKIEIKVWKGVKSFKFKIIINFF